MRSEDTLFKLHSIDKASDIIEYLQCIFHIDFYLHNCNLYYNFKLFVRYIKYLFLVQIPKYSILNFIDTKFISHIYSEIQPITTIALL